MAPVADGGGRKMVSHKVAFLPHSSSTSIRMTNRSTQAPRATCMLMTSVLPRRSSPLKMWKRHSAMLWLAWLLTMLQIIYGRIQKKTQLSVFHLKNRAADRQLRVRWYGQWLKHTTKPVYLGVTLDRSLTYKEHVAKTKAKAGARNSILKKLANSRWGTDANTIRTTALALCYSTAEYAAPVWCRSSHAAKIDPVLNAACRAITGCLRPTGVDDLYLPSGIAPPHIRREVSARAEKNKQEVNPLHPLFNCTPAKKRLKSRRSFLHSTESLDGPTNSERITLWSNHLQSVTRQVSIGPSESLPPGSSQEWPTWQCLNRLRSGIGRCKVLMQKWGYNRNGDTTCDYGEDQTMQHLLVCPLLPEPCTTNDLESLNPKAKSCILHWKGLV